VFYPGDDEDGNHARVEELFFDGARPEHKRENPLDTHASFSKGELSTRRGELQMKTSNLWATATTAKAAAALPFVMREPKGLPKKPFSLSRLPQYEKKPWGDLNARRGRR